ncbi:transposase [Streptomyces sp. NPDC020996]|uniref:IS701 family transposase n=1 Tax=Streptomyces sp. NPDC020996 TaxID=3154791 RepID=UPI0033FA0482
MRCTPLSVASPDRTDTIFPDQDTRESGQVRTIPIRSLWPDVTGRSRGESDEYVEMLSQLSGKLPPIVVHRNTMRVIEGMHRLKAVQLRGEQSIDVIFVDGDERDVFVPAGRPNDGRGVPSSLAGRGAESDQFPKSPAQQPDRDIRAAAGLVPEALGAKRGCSTAPDVASAMRTTLDGRGRPICMADVRGITCERVLPQQETPVRQLPGHRPYLTSGGGSAPQPDHVRREETGPLDITLLDELCDDLFGMLVRRDQRQRARQYLLGLLQTPGRKTIRNIAAFIGGPGIDQRLHHFISDSTWGWEPVRAALAQYVRSASAPEAWVIRPVMIPKAGLHTVGVSRRFCPARRKAVHAQQAVGVLAVSGQGSFPVGWRLQMPKEWLEDDQRRSRAALPDNLRAESLGECMAQAFLRVPGEHRESDPPALLDGRDLDTTQLFRTLCTARFPVLVRIPHSMPLYVNDAGLAGYRPHAPQIARQIAEAAKYRRRPITVLDSGTPKALMVAAVDVQAPIGSDFRQPPMQLLTVSPLGESTNEELWVTTLTSMPIASIVGLTRLLQRVDRDLEEISEQVGIWDFSGRSYPGWHRHVTLASAAHAARVLVGPGHLPDMSGR